MRRATFGRLETDDIVFLVARRLRAAIGLGVLNDGDKLPREQDLARQLGVTAFSLREALGIVRAEGLIVTRAGKKGGSFVRAAPEASRSLVLDGLIRLSAADLRDLGDWRQMLTGQAAVLAAGRASSASADRLMQLATEMTATTSARIARRVFGSFHLELAAAAQSMRLSRAEFAMHEEFDWLATALLDDGPTRVAVGERMTTTAHAVGHRDPVAANRAAGEMIRLLVDGLSGVRLSLLAANLNSFPFEVEPYELHDAVRLFFEKLLLDLSGIGVEVTPVLADAADSADLRRRVSHSVLSRFDSLSASVHGIGVAAEALVVQGAPFWMDWWQRSIDGSFVRDERHVLDPDRDDFYDYSTKDFFTGPRVSGAASAIGPYVDFGGEDDYLITVAMPLSSGDRFLGVTAADVLVSQLESIFAPWLARAPGPMLLINAEPRVILSNSVAYHVGDVLSTTEDLLVYDVGMFGWCVATSDSVRPGNA